MKKIIPFALLFVVAFTSCKDEETTPDPTPLTTKQKLQHKWNIVSIIDYNYVGATTTPDDTDTIDIGVGGYADFRTDDKMYANINGDLDTLSYQIINDNALSMDGEPYVINELSTNKLIMTYEERTDTPYYDNVISFDR